MDGFSLPTDDGAIGRALAELEAKLSDWTARMQHAHEKLLSLAHGDAPVAAAPKSEPPPAKAEEPPAAPAPEETRVTDRLGAGLSSPAHRLSPPAGESAVGPAPSPAAIETPPESAPPARNAEDEALLASLDDKTAQAIRIMRRLNPGKKSVRELVEEYRQSAQAQESTPAPAKGGLWKRIRG